MTSLTMARRAARHTAKALAALAVTIAAACSTDVTNPGPIQADFLENKNALTAIVNGAGRNLAEAINWTSYTGAAISRELHPAGSTGSFGITVQQQNGKLTIDEGNQYWNSSHLARWTAEDAITRTKGILGDADAAKSTTVAQALVWAGFANRHLGENFCEAVIDGDHQAQT